MNTARALFDGRDPTALVLLAIALLTALRIAVLVVSPLNLGPDEAQYWTWSLAPGAGYYSKPPMIAWMIGLSTSVFGDQEWAIRLPSPIMHGITGFILYLCARRLGDARAGAWACALYLTIPGVSFASGLMTTDTPLLMFWAWALYCLVHFRETGAKGWAAAMGAVLGLAFLAKYAALYFLVGLGVWAVLSKEARRLLISPAGGLAFIAALAVSSPNILWNALNDWPTAAHTAANANWRGDLFNVEEALQFFGDQFGVVGPVILLVFLILAVGAMTRRHGRDHDTARMLVALSLPILVIGLAQAFISRANANWAAPAYVAAVTLAALSAGSRRWVRLAATVSLVLHIAVMSGLYAMAARPALADAAGLSNAFKRVRGWETSVARALDLVEGTDVDVVIAENRLVMAELLYYGRDRLTPILAWDQDGVPKHHFELAYAYAPDAGERAVLITHNADPQDILARFESHTPLAVQTVATGRGKTRTLHLFRVEGPKDALYP